MRTAIICVLTAGVLAGCAGASKDPHEGGFFGGVAGLSSGEYDRRLQDRDENLQRLRQTQAELDAESDRLERRKATKQARVEDLRARLKRLERDTRALNRRINDLAQQSAAGDARVTEAQRRARDLKQRIATQQSALDALEGGGQGDTDIDQRRRQLEAQREALQKEYDALLQYTLQLAP